MIGLLVIAGAIGLYFLAPKAEAKSGVTNMNQRLFDLKDVLPENQGGDFITDYDIYFEAAADEFKVPFALLKAHAIQESSLNPSAYVNENPTNQAGREGWASRGLMQVLWWYGSSRLAKFGYTDDQIGITGSLLFDPHVNTRIAAQIIASNLRSVKGSLRDAINMYNTGKTEAQFEAPANYVDKVLNYYNQLIGA